MELNEKQKIYIMFGIFGIAAVVVYYGFLLKPLFSGFIAKNRDFYAIKTRVKDAEALIAGRDSIKKQLDILKEQSKSLEKTFPGKDEISSLLEDLSKVAESSGVKILKIKPVEEPPLPVAPGRSNAVASKDIYSPFPILIEARCGYHQCGFFINKLENMDRFIKIDHVDIIGRSESPRYHDIKLRAMTYVVQ